MRITSSISQILLSIFCLTFMVQPVAAVTLVSAKTPIRRPAIRYDLYNSKKTYKDEKIDLTSVASHCNTPALQKRRQVIHDTAIQDGHKYGAKMNGTTSTAVDLAYEQYQQALTLAWSAMEEPYCGIGAFGLQAAKKSYEKSVTRARDKFVKRVKVFKK